VLARCLSDCVTGGFRSTQSAHSRAQGYPRPLDRLGGSGAPVPVESAGPWQLQAVDLIGELAFHELRSRPLLPPKRSLAGPPPGWTRDDRLHPDGVVGCLDALLIFVAPLLLAGMRFSSCCSSSMRSSSRSLSWASLRSWPRSLDTDGHVSSPAPKRHLSLTSPWDAGSLAPPIRRGSRNQGWRLLGTGGSQRSLSPRD
jgi:hypothetical protein